MKRVIGAEEKKRRIAIINRSEGIHPPFEAFYIHSITYAAKASDEAFRRFERAIIKDESPAAVVSAVQEALTHAAGLSRFFWPAREKGVAGARAAKLRQAFQMDGSPLQDRGLRNALEHFDERLDEFLLGDPVGYFFPEAIIDDHTLADEQPGQIFRLVDPYECVFVILGEKYAFLPIVEEVKRILKLARQFDGAGSRLPYPT